MNNGKIHSLYIENLFCMEKQILIFRTKSKESFFVSYTSDTYMNHLQRTYAIDVRQLYVQWKKLRGFRTKHFKKKSKSVDATYVDISCK